MPIIYEIMLNCWTLVLMYFQSRVLNLIK